MASRADKIIDGKRINVLIVHNQHADLMVTMTSAGLFLKKKTSSVLNLCNPKESALTLDEIGAGEIKTIKLKTKKIDLTLLID